MCAKNVIFGILHYICEDGKYLTTIFNNSVIMCDDIIDETKTVLTNFNEKKATCKTQNFYILLGFLLITNVYLLAVSIYCYFIRYQAKKIHLFPFHGASDKLRAVL